MITKKIRNQKNIKNRKKYQCSQCDAKYNHLISLKDHITGVHEGKRPYLCTICGADYTQNANLRRQIDEVHEQTKRFTLPCVIELLVERFTWKNMYLRFMKASNFNVRCAMQNTPIS